MLSQLRPALLMTLVLTVLTGLAYPIAMTGICQALFPHQANGSLITHNGTTVGSALLGQNFSGQGYFHPRPSAAGTNGYDATSSGGSNLGPTNPDLIKRLNKDAAAYHADNGDHTPIPSDAITTSASGLDPDISPANAFIQSARVAAARRADPGVIEALIRRHIEGRQWGVFGEPRVNVLALNLDLDRQFPR